MKKGTKAILSVSLASALVFTSFPALTFAAEEVIPSTMTQAEKIAVTSAKIQKDEAIELAKKYVTIPDDYKLNSVNFSSNWGYPNRAAWSLYWRLEENNQTKAHISVTIDANEGILLSLDSYQYKESPSMYPAKVSLEEAKKIADEYVKKIYPDLLNQVEVDPNFLANYQPPLNGPVYYSFPYRRMVNGIPFSDQSIYVQVNGDGEVTNFNYNFTGDIEFEDADQYLTAEEAKAKFAEQFNINLSFILPYRQYKGNGIVYLAYTSLEPQYINAKTGETFYLPGQPKAVDASTFKPIVDQPLASAPKEGKELTEEQITKIAEDLIKKFSVDDLKLQSLYYNSNYYPSGHAAWNISFANEDKRSYSSMAIDAITGELLSFYMDDYTATKDTDKNKLTYEQAKQVAIDAVKTFSPSKAHEVYLQDVENTELMSQEGRAYFNFRRLVHGIPTDRENINVNVNLKTGKVTNYDSYWGVVNYPKELPKTIDMEKAKEIMLSKVDLELVYFAPYPSYTIYGKPTSQEQTRKAYLVYRPKDTNMYKYNYAPTFLDATTGEWRSREDGSIIQDKVQPVDIKGHWAEKELQVMVNYKALDVKDGKVLPDANITRGELIKMFIMAQSGGNYYPYIDTRGQQSFKDVGKESAYYAFVEDAVRRNLITIDKNKEFKPDEAITREELAQFVVKALGYDKLAQTKGLFAIKFKDQDQLKYPGHVAIVSALQIMNGDGTNFKPNEKVTRAVAAKAFYRFLEVRNNYRENPQYYY
ncbi:YcdB/YcdC domain-containing protein [Tepidibacillus decaturensis]|uniref:SLH domain-containing protein n=1 Tax=Tepidibacillus decaturensis TaxID=1413211 RepID=A0A135L4N9_9BACI|nr:YcdB/YcdC domain-containing protein [Tepidibacillus decaturensis]KXG43975.1 hypothetical protein U473_08110 [Tepidibacillus decaturensis]